ncbi:hypothetical protein HPB47_000164, partial [Ixodes persulcatus]
PAKKTDEEEERLIVAAAVADPFLSAREIRDELHRRLKEAGSHNFVAARRLEFAQALRPVHTLATE